MITVYYSSVVDNIIEQYYEDYVGTAFDNDLWIRVLNLRRIREYLSVFDTSETYTIDDKEYVDIEDICIVEFSMKNESEILIKNLYFKD